MMQPLEDNSGFERSDMPQVSLDDARRIFAKHGIPTNQLMVDPRELKPSQAEYSDEKVQDIIDKARGPLKAIISTEDQYIVDGHHRALAAQKMNYDFIDSLVVSCSCQQAIFLLSNESSTSPK